MVVILPFPFPVGVFLDRYAGRAGFHPWKIGKSVRDASLGTVTYRPGGKASQVVTTRVAGRAAGRGAAVPRRGPAPGARRPGTRIRSKSARSVPHNGRT